MPESAPRTTCRSSPQHLYVRDGDLAAEDKIFKEIEANWAANAKDAAPSSRSCSRARRRKDELDAFVAARAEMVETQKAVLELARRDRQQRRGRSGSRSDVRDDTPLELGLEARGRR